MHVFIFFKEEDGRRFADPGIVGFVGLRRTLFNLHGLYFPYEAPL